MEKSTIALSALLLVIILLFISFFIIKDTKLHGDENVHYGQILQFSKGNYLINSALTTIPGYHILLASIAKISSNSLPFIRLLNFFLSLISIGIFFLLAKKISPSSSALKSIQYTLFPILFPLFFLVYTDVLSLLLVMLAILCAF